MSDDWTAKPTRYWVFVAAETEADEPYLVEAFDVDFSHGWLRVEPSDDYAGGDAGSPEAFFHPSSRVIVVERLRPAPTPDQEGDAG